jgi:AcrR family transcriptional regulator
MTTPPILPTAAGPDHAGRRQDARRNHERIVRAALEVFAEHGLQATVPQVAERAGVGKATVYRSYPTKDDLVSAVVLHQYRQLERRTADAFADPDPYRALHTYVLDLFESLAGDRLLADALSEATLVSTVHIVDLLTSLVEAAKPTGRVRADAGEMDVRVLICGAVLQLMAVGGRDPEVWRRYGELVLNALRP